MPKGGAYGRTTLRGVALYRAALLNRSCAGAQPARWELPYLWSERVWQLCSRKTAAKASSGSSLSSFVSKFFRMMR